MSRKRQMILEVLSGPSDGAVITLEKDTHWRQTGQGPLAFPWDVELGEPQARFIAQEDGWYIEGIDALHGTYLRGNRDGRIGKKMKLERYDILEASYTWLRLEMV